MKARRLGSRISLQSAVSRMILYYVIYFQSFTGIVPREATMRRVGASEELTKAFVRRARSWNSPDERRRETDVEPV